MANYGQCNLCKKGELVQVDKKHVSDTIYVIVKCNKCNHQTAKRE